MLAGRDSTPDILAQGFFVAQALSLYSGRILRTSTSVCDQIQVLEIIAAALICFFE